jgi:hypothetical protein
MKSIRSNWQSLLTGLVALGGVGVAMVALVGGCETGGNEGDRCNPLVQQDECDNGLHCKAATCSESYCCPIDLPGFSGPGLLTNLPLSVLIPNSHNLS